MSSQPQLESKFKSELIAQIKLQYPGAIILKTDANQLQGILDNIILFKDKWAAFEAKRSQFSPHRPNQDYYAELMNEMSYASFVYPENKEVFLNELHETFRPNRSAFISKR